MVQGLHSEQQPKKGKKKTYIHVLISLMDNSRVQLACLRINQFLLELLPKKM